MANQFDPLEFAQYAQRSVLADQSEACLRTAVGRLYYAAFLTALWRLYPQGTIPRHRLEQQPTNRRSIHAVVVDDVRDRSFMAGTQLDRLRVLRVQADYHPSPEPRYAEWTSNWQNASALCQSVLPSIQRL